MKEVEIKSLGDTLFAYILCEIDHHSAKAIREKLDPVLASEQPQRLIFDFSQVGFMDSSGIGLILGRVAESEKIGASVGIVGLCDKHMKILRMAGIEKIKGVELKLK